jgi:hypothetical protein
MAGNEHVKRPCEYRYTGCKRCAERYIVDSCHYHMLFCSY